MTMPQTISFLTSAAAMPCCSRVATSRGPNCSSSSWVIMVTRTLQSHLCLSSIPIGVHNGQDLYLSPPCYGLSLLQSCRHTLLCKLIWNHIKLLPTRHYQHSQFQLLCRLVKRVETRHILPPCFKAVLYSRETELASLNLSTVAGLTNQMSSSAKNIHKNIHKKSSVCETKFLCFHKHSTKYPKPIYWAQLHNWKIRTWI